MKLSLLGVMLAFALSGCGGKQGGGGPELAGGGDAGTALQATCDRFVNAVRTKGTCDKQADERSLEYGRTLCEERARQVPAGCEAAFDGMYDCYSQEAGTCDGPGCGTEQRDYAECASAGSCTTVGGGTHRRAAENPDHADIFTTHELCQCVEGWETGAPGDACDTYEDCSTVCCTCPGSTMQYTAAACDESATGGTGVGRCASAEAACALTASRCQ